MRFGRSCLESSNLFPTTIVRSFIFTSNLKRKKENDKKKIHINLLMIFQNNFTGLQCNIK